MIMYKINTGIQAILVHIYIVKCTSKLLPVDVKSEMLSIKNSNIWKIVGNFINKRFALLAVKVNPVNQLNL